MATAERTMRRRRESATAAAASVLFKAPSGTRAKRVKLGFAWDLFLFSCVFGLPLFLRGLPNWGAAVLALWLADLGLARLGQGPWHLAAQIALFAAFLGLEVFLGLKGNALTARAYSARGWRPDERHDAGVRRALERWGLAAGQ
jgi:hypothetical protein